MFRYLRLVSAYFLLFIVFGCGNSSSPIVASSIMGGAIAGQSVSSKGIVSTFAGSAATPFQPFCITSDGTNLYVADTNTNTIRKIVIATREVTTLAGTASTTGHADGTGSVASFNKPYGITTDGTMLYVADTGNNTIRKIVIATGAVTTLALTGGESLNAPHGITTDRTNLYVADTGNNIVRKIVIGTGVVTTLAGAALTTGHVDGTGPAASFNKPYGITMDRANLYIADTGNNIVRKIVIATGTVTTLAGTAPTIGHADGTGTAASFNSPYGITTDGANLYVVDTGNNSVRKIVIATGTVTTLAGTASTSGYLNGTGPVASFNIPYGITTDGTHLYVADTYYNIIRKIVIATSEVTTILTLNDSTTTIPPGSDDGMATTARFYQPFGITTDGTNLYVADYRNSSIRKIVIATGSVTTLACPILSFVAPTGITTDGTDLYVVDTSTNSILKISPATGAVTRLAGTAAGFNKPYGITTDGTNLYVADMGNNTIGKIVIATGSVTTLATGFSGPYGITTDGTNLYVADTGNNSIKTVVIATGTVTTLAGSTSSGSTNGTGTTASFSNPFGITTDGTTLYVADTGNNTIRKIVIATGEVTTLAGTALTTGHADRAGIAASFNSPYGITTDGINLYVTDTGNNTIRKIQ